MKACTHMVAGRPVAAIFNCSCVEAFCPLASAAIWPVRCPSTVYLAPSQPEEVRRRGQDRDRDRLLARFSHPSDLE